MEISLRIVNVAFHVSKRIHPDDFRGHGCLGCVDEALPAQFICGNGEILINVANGLPSSKEDRFWCQRDAHTWSDCRSVKGLKRRTHLHARRYPLMTDVGWIFCFTNSSALFSNSAAMMT